MEKIPNAVDDSLTIKKETLWKYSTFALFGILIIGAIYMFSTRDATVTGNVVANNPPVINPATERVEIDITGAPVLGKENAEVTVVEFSDYQCPFCERAYSDAVKQIKQNYIDSGKVKFVFMDFPLSFHPEALPAARAARCFEFVKDGNDAEYFKYHNKIFENQQSIGTENYKKWARELGADGAKFDTCFDSDKFTEEINKQSAYGQQVGVQGTPAFFINGKLLSGAQPFAAFKTVIDAELA